MMPRALAALGVVLLALMPLLGLSDYHLHILILILLWAFIYTGWSIMGRFGLVSLGHGAFLGIGAYTVTMLWNHFGITPWLGIPAALLLACADRAGDRLPVLPLPHHRPLLRARHAGAVRGRAPADRGAARLHRRLARRDPAHRARRQLLLALRAAVRRQGGLVLRHAAVLARRACGSGVWSTAAWRATRWRRSARRRTPPPRSASTSPGPSSGSR